MSSFIITKFESREKLSGIKAFIKFVNEKIVGEFIKKYEGIKEACEKKVKFVF